MVNMVLALHSWLSDRLNRPARQRHFIDTCEFPGHLQRAVLEDYPHLSRADTDQVLDGLRDWFRICHAKGLQPLGMPSKVVDAAWHAFILDTRAYAAFCQQAFGRLLHHIPAEAMTSRVRGSPGLARTWKAALRLDGQNPYAPVAVPPLFALDRRLDIPGGYRFTLDCRSSRDPLVYCGSHLVLQGDGTGGGYGEDVPLGEPLPTGERTWLARLFGGRDRGDSSGCGGGCGGD